MGLASALTKETPESSYLPSSTRGHSVRAAVCEPGGILVCGGVYEHRIFLWPAFGLPSLLNRGKWISVNYKPPSYDVLLQQLIQSKLATRFYFLIDLCAVCVPRHLSHVWLFAALWTVDRQALLCSWDEPKGGTIKPDQFSQLGTLLNLGGNGLPSKAAVESLDMSLTMT